MDTRICAGRAGKCSGFSRGRYLTQQAGNAIGLRSIEVKEMAHDQNLVAVLFKSLGIAVSAAELGAEVGRIIDMQFRYTKNQVPRGALADSESHDKMFLLKNVSTLRLTYQIRLLTFKALDSKKKLILRVPTHCRIDTNLREFVRQQQNLIRIDRV